MARRSWRREIFGAAVTSFMHGPALVPRHAWQEGRCVTFDDTWEHEAWNRSDRTRVVLILDRWRPDLSEAEPAAVTDLVEAIGDFNQSSEIPAPVTMK